MASDSDATIEAPTEEKPKLSLDVKVDTKSACERHVTVTVTREDIERYYKDAFDELQPKAEVPGFRPGRAPRRLVESKFREQMSDQVKGSLLMDSVTQASEQCEFSAISEPDFDFEAIEMPEDGPMTFEFDIEVRPEFDMPEWEGLKLERPVHDYSDEEVEAQLKELLVRYGKTIKKDGPADDKDFVTLNVVFKFEDDVISKIEGETVQIKKTLSLRDGNLEEFDKLMIGAQAGDRREGSVTVTQEAEDEKLRGQNVDVQFEVTAVRRTELPELTPGFLDRIGGFESTEELHDTVREELERQIGYHQQRRVRQQITAVLTEGAGWELPPHLLRKQATRELERAVLELRSSGFNDDAIQTHANQLRQNSMASTERALKEHFILERIAEEREIDAEEHDFDAEIRKIAMQGQDSPRRVRARIEKRGQMDALRNQIIESKVIDLITSAAEFTDTPFEPAKDETVGIDHAISGQEDEADIPEAKYGGDAEELRGPAERG